MARFGTRRALAVAAAVASLAVAGCGSDDDDNSSDADSNKTESTASNASGADLAAIKTYLLDHTTRLVADTGQLREQAEEYYALAEAADFDYQKLLDEKRSEVKAILDSSKETFQKANPAYEEMEGVVAGVPELADFDVIIDAGSDASDPESAVPFSLETPAGEEYKQPGNFFSLLETSLYGTEPKWAAKDVEPDLDGNGEVDFGEGLPDADFYVTAARDFEKNAQELEKAANEWEPTLQDAMTAVVVMTPTMSEYFDAWKNSRFIAGEKAEEKGFVAASRLQDIADILSGLVLIYDNIEPSVAKADAAQAKQTGDDLKKLYEFASRLRDEEAGGKKFTASDADTLGSEAQAQAEAIAGQVSQAAGRLNIELEN
jgi:hypothetical protein